ncbi:MAG: hypothetical protein LBG58_08480 [Planctomycetaceae bacterium]|jgi:hypothetical protein|nr:hypothetical protein [Planctomycetaceae bacterium]
MFPITFEVAALTGGKVKLEIYENKITIERIGVVSFALHGLKGTKTLYFSRISAVQFKRSDITGGYIQFTIPGGLESTGGWFNAHADENSIRFGYEDDEIMSCVHKFIEVKIANEDSRNEAIALQLVIEKKQHVIEKKQQTKQDENYQNELFWKPIETLNKEERKYLIEKGLLPEESQKYLEELDKLSGNEREERIKQKQAKDARFGIGCLIVVIILALLGVTVYFVFLFLIFSPRNTQNTRKKKDIK